MVCPLITKLLQLLLAVFVRLHVCLKGFTLALASRASRRRMTYILGRTSLYGFESDRSNLVYTLN